MPTLLPKEDKPSIEELELYCYVNNMITLLLTILLILVLGYIFNNLYCLWGLLLLINLKVVNRDEN